MDNPAKQAENMSIFRFVEDQLRNPGLVPNEDMLPKRRIFFRPDVEPTKPEFVARLKAIATEKGAEVVDTEAEATHVIFRHDSPNADGWFSLG